jgi:hypothetical protein
MRSGVRREFETCVFCGGETGPSPICTHCGRAVERGGNPVVTRATGAVEVTDYTHLLSPEARARLAAWRKNHGK